MEHHYQFHICTFILLPFHLNFHYFGFSIISRLAECGLPLLSYIFGQEDLFLANPNSSASDCIWKSCFWLCSRTCSLMKKICVTLNTLRCTYLSLLQNLLYFKVFLHLAQKLLSLFFPIWMKY